MPMMQAPDADFLEFVWIWNATQKQGMPAPHRRIARWLQLRWDARDRACC